MTVTSGDMSLYSSSGSRSIATSVGTDDASSHEPKPISTPNGLAISAPSGLAAMAVSHSADETLRLAIPEIHQKAAEPSARRIVWPRACRLGERKRQRKQHAGASGVAWKCRRDDAIDEEHAIGQSQCGSSEHTHNRIADALSQTARDDGARHQEGEHDQKNRSVGKTRVGLAPVAACR